MASSNSSSIDDIFQQLKRFKLAPVDNWSPQIVQDINLRIAADGRWYYKDSLIGRHKIAQLFSTLLVKEQQDYFLITPHIKYPITVDDAAFMAVEMSVVEENDKQVLYFRTNMDEVVGVDNHHSIVLHQTDEQQAVPYVNVRNGLLAKLTRAVFYQLADYLEYESLSNKQFLGVYSRGVYFPLYEETVN